MTGLLQKNAHMPVEIELDNIDQSIAVEITRLCRGEPFEPVEPPGPGGEHNGIKRAVAER
jgi:hypothetical protein